jgi:FMN reductase
VTVVAVHAGESATSRTRALAVAALDLAGGGHLVELSQLGAEGLLGRVDDPDVADAVARSAAATTLVLASPIYRATVSGPMKAFLDRFPPDALRGTAVVLAATAQAREHHLALDTSGRALVASLGGWTVPTVVFAVSDDVVDGVPSASILRRLQRALAEAALVTRVDDER